MITMVIEVFLFYHKRIRDYVLSCFHPTVGAQPKKRI